MNVEEQLVKLLETTKVQSIVKERQYTEEEKRIREQILAQYSQVKLFNKLLYNEKKNIIVADLYIKYLGQS